MPPKKSSASSSKEAANSEPPHEYKTGDIVLCKVKGFPEWPGKLQEHASAPGPVKKVQGNKQHLVRFFPDGDYHWAILKEMKYLSPKSIDAYLSDTSKKGGKLRKSYEIAQDPSEWEAEIAEKGAAAMQQDDDEDEDVDMLDGDDGEADGKSKKKRKREPAAKKEKAPKKEPASKKRKTDDKKEKAPAKGKADSKDDAKPADDDNSEEAKKVKGWRASLQKAFLTKGVPPANKMDEYDQLFKDMEGFEMQTQWLTTSKLGKVLKKMSALENIAKNEEYKITDRCTALVEKWKEMMAKEGEDPQTATAGDVTMLPAEEEKKEEKPAEAAPAEENKAETNGTNGTTEA